MNKIIVKLKTEEEKLTERLREISQEKQKIQDNCEHKVIRNTYYYYKNGKEDPNSGHPGDGVDNCPKCDYDFGFPAWWCPKTKGVCDYDGQDDYHLTCKNCGYPEERK